jgi:ornithine decarboxylase
VGRVQVYPSSHGRDYHRLLLQHGSPLLLLDCHQAEQQYHQLKAALPGVNLYYAVKSLNHPLLLSALARIGSGFEMASCGEMEQLRQLGIPPQSTIHTHPIKRDADIRAVLRYGCTTFVVDNADELGKFQPYRHRVGLLLRLSFRSRKARVDLSKKFGCAPAAVGGLLRQAVHLGIHIKGLCFHVGSQCADALAQAAAIETCNQVIRRHHATGAAPISYLDIGGGFPAPYRNEGLDIELYCAPIRKALSALPDHVRVIAEPGRFISAPAMTGLTTVIGRAVRDDVRWYYLDDGVYGAFSGQLFDHVRYPLVIFSDSHRRFNSVLAGPTCDSIDLIAENLRLPPLQLGDVVAGRLMGAYTVVSATLFNSLEKTRIVALPDACHPIEPSRTALCPTATV